MSQSIPESTLFGVDTVHGSKAAPVFAWGYSSSAADDLALERISDNLNLIEFTQNSSTPVNFPQGLTAGDGNPVLTTASSVDAQYLDGYDHTDFIHANQNDELVGDLNVTGTLTEAGSPVLTSGDPIDADTLAGKTLDGVRPTAEDDNTSIVSSYSAINFAGNMTVTDDGDGTITIDVADSSNVGDTRVNVSDNGSQVVSYADDINFAKGANVTDDGDNSVTVTSYTYTVSDDGTQIVDSPRDINAGNNMTATADGDGTVTLSGVNTDTNTHTGVSATGTQVYANVDDINFRDGLSVTDDTDGTVTVDATSLQDADTLDGLDSTAFVQRDGTTPLTGLLDAGGYGFSNLGELALPASSGASASITDPNNNETIITYREGSGTPALANRSIEFKDGVGISHDPSGSYTTRIRPWRTGMGTLTGGGNLPSPAGMAIEADATVALIESDNDEVTGWLNLNSGAATLNTGIRVGDRGGEPQAALDVRGNMRLSGAMNNAAFEARTSDPSSPRDGRVWVRTDV